jgi:hypothetical protein
MVETFERFLAGNFIKVPAPVRIIAYLIEWIIILAIKHVNPFCGMYIFPENGVVL